MPASLTIINLKFYSMRILNTELIKLGNNRFYWFAATFYILFLLLFFWGNLVGQGATSLSGVIEGVFHLGIMLNLVLFCSFVVGMVCGQEFQFNSFKYELISGRTRKGKAVAGFLNIFLQVVFMTSLLLGLGGLYYVIVHHSFPAFEPALGVVLLKFFFAFFFYSVFVYCVTLLSRHGIATIFICVAYIVLEMMVVNFNLLKLDEPGQFYPYLFATSILDMVGSNWQETFWLSTIRIPLTYALVFALLSYIRIKRMQFK